MSKYIKLEDAIEQVKTEFYGGGYQEWLEISIDNLINRIANLPTIEVSEDCISREWVLEEYQKGKEKISKTECFDELMWLVKHAPSVAPTTEQSCDTCRYRKLYECSDCRFASKWERIEE